MVATEEQKYIAYTSHVTVAATDRYVAIVVRGELGEVGSRLHISGTVVPSR